MSKNTRTYSDIDLNFAAHPVTGDLVKRYDENAIKQSLKCLILTSNYERPFNSGIGSHLRGLLFEPAEPNTVKLIQRTIEQTILNYEPRVVLQAVQATLSPDNNSVYVSIQFTMVNTTAPQVLNLTLERTR